MHINKYLKNISSLAGLAALVLGSSLALAADSESFTQERFEALQAEDANILIDVYASWCPDCKKQQEVLGDYQAEHPDNDIHVLKVDFDDQKEWVTHFRAPRQSTLILFSGEERVWFSVAETRRDKIFEALNSL